MVSTIRQSKLWAGSAKRKAARLVGAMVALLLVGFPLFSQTQGSIQGGVFDQSGGAIAGATVTVIDVARGVSRSLVADGAGQYVAVNLTPGTYTVRAEAKGFSAVEHSGVLVEVGQSVRVDLTVQPGEQTQTVTVTAEIPAIDTTDTTLGGTVSNNAINSLPLNGRNFQRLLQLRPGVINPVGSATGNSATNGRRSGSDLLLFEGLVEIGQSTNGSLLNSSFGVGDVSTEVPIDAIQEFNTEQNPKAEYGWKDGSVINVGIKSGTNSLHGTAYAFGRDAAATDAANYFTGTVTPATLEQFGASAGGRIIKDKLFLFGNYEGLRSSLGSTSVVTIPSDIQLSLAQDPKSQLSLVNACQAVGPAKINALSALLVGLNPTTCVVSAGSSTVENVLPFNATASNNYESGLISTGPLNNGILKGDYAAGPHQHFSGTYFVSKVQQLGASNLLPAWNVVYPLTGQVFEGNWTWTPNSTLVNVVRGGYSYTRDVRFSEDHNLNPAAPWPNGYGINTGVTNPLFFGLPQILITGFSGEPGYNSANLRGPEGEEDFHDDVSYLHGTHAFKFGFEYVDVVRISDNYRGGSGLIKFGSLQNFLTGTVSASGSAILEGDDLQDIRWPWYAGFAQDDWRVSPRVTLNVGLRWDIFLSPHERNNYMGNFDPNVNPATQPAVQQIGPGQMVTDQIHPWPYDFQPRFGAAWDVRGNGKTVVRGGVSLIRIAVIQTQIVAGSSPFAANFPSIGVNNSGTAANAHTPILLSVPSTSVNWTSTGPIFPASATTQVVGGVTYTGGTCTAAVPCVTTGAVPNFVPPYALEWNFDIQRAITNNVSLDVAYVANHGGDEQYAPDLNQPALGAGWTSAAAQTANTGSIACLASFPSYNNCHVNAAAEVGPYKANFPYLSYIIGDSNGAWSNYEGLQVTLQARNYHGLSFISGYTYSHALDLESGQSGNGLVPTINSNIGLDYGNSVQDIRHRFTFAPSYAIPGKKSPGQMLEGWSVEGILTLQTGTPWTAWDDTNDFTGTNEIGSTTQSAATGMMQPWDFTGSPSAFKITTTPPPCFGSMAGCTPYSLVGGVPTPPAACMSAAQANGPLAVASLMNFGCYIEGASVLTPPAYGSVGTEGKDIFPGPGYKNVDFSVFKVWKFKERYSATFRAEFFNIFNHTDLINLMSANGVGYDPAKGVTGGFGYAQTTPDSSNSVVGSGGPRHIQFGLKLVF